MEIINVLVLILSVLCQNVSVEREHVPVGNIEYRCGEDGQIIATKINTTRLRLPVNCQAMYSVNTERTTACTNQRCTLMTWKIIRDLEMFFNAHHSYTNNSGIVEFNNEMIIPGFNYLVHVMVKNSRGELEEKDFNITFSHDTEVKSKIILGHLTLNIGSTFVYSSLPIIINANVTLCGNVSYYFFSWSLITSKQKLQLSERSSKLTILPHTLKTYNENSYLINCLVINVESNSSILEESTTVKIKDLPHNLQNKVNVMLPFKYTTINKGSPISIIPYIYSLAITDERLQVEWSCMFEQTWLYGCQGQINTEFYMETGFDQEGNYSITLKATRGKLTNSATCFIIIITDVPSIELDVEHPIKPERGIEVTSKIFGLRTYCFLHWDSDEQHYMELNNIPGFHKETHTISSKDQTFLQEIVDFGNITVTKQFKLKIPPPSRNWKGLEANTYNLKIIVSCPALTEINDMNIVKEVPEHFITISAQAEFIVPLTPQVKSFKILSDDDLALKSNYSYIVDRANETCGPMIYQYGFILEKMEVILYSGIDIFTVKTLMPYSGADGIETFIKVCDYQNQCGKTFGAIIKTRLPSNLNKRQIFTTFKQLLIEQDFYKAFSYAFIVLHSASCSSDEIKNYRNRFSSEILEIMEIIRQEEHENKKAVLNDLLKNLLIFIQHLVFSEEVMKKLLLMSKEFSTNTVGHRRAVRHASRNLLSTIQDNEATLEEIKNHLAASEYVILNSLLVNIESNNKEKDHMINLLDEWMILACDMLFHEQRVKKIEMQTMAFNIEKISKKLLNNFITIPLFGNDNWNVTTKLQIKNISEHSSNKLCLGQTVLNSFFNKNGVLFGANIYSANEQTMEVNVSALIRIFLPIDPDRSKTKQPKCAVYKKGFIISCSVGKEFSSVIECFCPSFGYYFIEYTDRLTNVDSRNVDNFQNVSYYEINQTDKNYNIGSNVYGSANLGKRISYVIIFSSLVGFIILCYIIRKLTIVPQQHIGIDGLQDNVLYGYVMNEEVLE